MRNDGTETIAATTVVIGVHMDAQIRKACRFPKEKIERAQPLVVEITPVI